MDDKPERPPPITRERAYRNADFIESRDGRALRILAEYLEPSSRFRHHRIDDTIVFMGSARLQSREDAEAALAEVRRSGGDVALAERKLALSVYYEAARDLAGRLTEWSKALGQGERRFLVCTGGGPGIMEAANRGASEARGLNVGLGITLPHEQSLNPYISRELAFNFHYFFMRKFWFAYPAKAVVFFPGGFGTLDEFFELLTLLQTGKIRKHMPIVLFGSEYWNDVFNLDAMVKHGTIDARDLELIHRTDSIDDAFDYLVRELIKYGLPNPGVRL
jgi:uncharacterized protein (TIGR00730 family)